MKKHLCYVIVVLMVGFVGTFSLKIYFPNFLYNWRHPALFNGFDYSILTKKDLEWYYKGTLAVIFNEKDIWHEYWYCLDKQFVKPHCEYDNPKDISAVFGIDIETNHSCRNVF